ncbi:MAG: glycosyltransferase family 39 protein, partial [bacterium]
MILTVCSLLFSIAWQWFRIGWYGSGEAGEAIAAGALTTRGLSLYADIWHGGMPGVAWIATIVTKFSPSLMSIFVIEWVCTFICAVLIYFVARSVAERMTALSSASLFIAVSAGLTVRGAAGGKFYILLMLLAILIALRRKTSSFLVGILAGLAVMFHLSALISGAAILFAFCLGKKATGRLGSSSPNLFGGVSIAAGLVSPFILLIVLFAAGGTLPALYDCVLRFGFYELLERYRNYDVQMRGLVDGLMMGAVLWGLPLIYGSNPSNRSTSAIFRWWFAAEALCMALTLDFSPGAMLRCFAPLAVLTAFAIERICGKANQKPHSVLRTSHTLVFLLFMVMIGKVSSNLYGIGDSGREDRIRAEWRRAVAEMVHRFSEEDDLIYVWGSEAVLYHEAGRLPASRFFISRPFFTH